MGRAGASARLGMNGARGVWMHADEVVASLPVECMIGWSARSCTAPKLRCGGCAAALFYAACKGISGRARGGDARSASGVHDNVHGRVRRGRTGQSAEWKKEEKLRLVHVLAALGAAFGLAALARYGWIEPAAAAQWCNAADPSLACRLRDVLIAIFLREGFGWAALVVALLALVTRRAGLALAGACLGAVGLVLYSFEPAAVASLLSALVLARSMVGRAQRSGQQHAGGEQQA